jgi:hypothetical protein
MKTEDEGLNRGQQRAQLALPSKVKENTLSYFCKKKRDTRRPQRRTAEPTPIRKENLRMQAIFLLFINTSSVGGVSAPRPLSAVASG